MMAIFDKSLSGFMKYYAFIGMAIMLSLAGVFFVGPVAFQKANLIKIDDGSYSTAQSDEELFDVASFLSSIPYQDKPQMIWDVLPENKYRKAIIEGGGNCSNLVFGAAHYLIDNEVDFSIVHLMPKSSFLRGGGHTVLELGYAINGAEKVALVDILEAGLPIDAEGNALRLEDLLLSQDGMVEYDLIRLNRAKSGPSRYWNDAFISSATPGWISGNEVRDYFRFIDFLYFNFGSARLEKYLFDGLALLVGKLPTIYVTDTGFSDLFSYDRNNVTLVISRISLTLLRLSGLAVLLLVLFHVVYRLRKVL